MSVTDYAPTPAGNATGLFPEGMSRSSLNDQLRVQQSHLRLLVNNFPFFDIGTGTGTATYAFVSSNSFVVENVDVTAFYSTGRRVKITGPTIGAVFASVQSAAFNSPSTLVTVLIDGGASLVNESFSVSLSILDPSGVPVAVEASSFSLLSVSDDSGANPGPTFELFRDSTSPAADDQIGIIKFTGRDSGGDKQEYIVVRGQIDDATAGSEKARLIIGGGLDLQSSDDSAAGGPALTLERISASPAIGDEMGSVEFQGKNSANATVPYWSVSTVIDNPAAGSEASSMTWRTFANGALNTMARLANTGIEFFRTVTLSADNTAPLTVNRNNSSGQLVRFSFNNGAAIGQIIGNATTGVVTYGTFTGDHWSEMAILEEADPVPGTLLSTVDQWFNQQKGLPKVEVTKHARCPRVYGVFGMRDVEDKKIHVNAIGTAPYVRCVGPVQAGDLLTSSDTPGVAERQGDDVIRSSTVGKVTQTDIRTGERLVAATLVSG